MIGSSQRVYGKAMGCLVALSLFLSLLMTVSVPLPAHAQSAYAAPLELPAMALNPTTLANAGVPGYTTLGGQTEGPEELARIAGDFSDQMVNEDIQAMLEEMGLIEGYSLGIRLLQDSANPESALARDIYGELHEFTGEGQAAKALAFIAALTIAEPEFVRVEGTGGLGQHAVYGRQTYGEGADTSHELLVIFQSGPVIAVLDLIDYLGVEPSISEIETLATLQQRLIAERIQTGSLGLGNNVPRLIDPEFGGFYEIRRDEYLRSDGVDIPRSLEDPAAAAVRTQLAGNATDVYAFQQFVDGTAAIDPALPDQFGIGTRLFRFHDDASASAWLADRPNHIQTEYQGSAVSVQDIQVQPDRPLFGDESLSISYTEIDTFGGPVFRIFVRVANTVADVRFNPLGDGSLATAESYAAFQAGCLVEACPGSYLATEVFLGQSTGLAPGMQTPPAAEITPTTVVSGSPPFMGQTILDLPAMTLMPRDLEESGLAGFGGSLGEMNFREALIASLSASRGIPEADVRSVLEGNGLVRRYDHFLLLPITAGDPESGAARLVVSYVLEFADENGAATAWSFMEDESFAATSVDSPLSTPLGQQSEATRERGVDTEGNPYEQLDVTFQIGNLHAGVAVIDWAGSSVDQITAEALATRLMQRIEAVRAGAAPALSGMVIRLSGADVVPLADEYSLLDGENIRAYGQSTDESIVASSLAASEHRIDGYRLQQQLTAGTDDTDDDTWYLVTLETFADAEGAGQWVAAAPMRLGENPAVATFQIIEGTVYGDASLLHTSSSTDGLYQYRSAIVQVGVMVVTIDLAAADSPPEAVLDALVQLQIACLREGGCLEPVAAPSESSESSGPGRD